MPEEKLPHYAFTNDISYEKKYLIKNPELIKQFVAPITIRYFSHLKDTIFFANEANKMRKNLKDNEIYDFLFYSIRPVKRFAKWDKKETDSKVDLIQEYYGYSRMKAKSVAHLLSIEDMEYIKQKLSKGGVQ